MNISVKKILFVERRSLKYFLYILLLLFSGFAKQLHDISCGCGILFIWGWSFWVAPFKIFALLDVLFVTHIPVLFAVWLGIEYDVFSCCGRILAFHDSILHSTYFPQNSLANLNSSRKKEPKTHISTKMTRSNYVSKKPAKLALAFSYAAAFSSVSALSSVQATTKAWNRAIVDYNAANQYFSEAYGSPYFSGDNWEPEIPVYNAREGFIKDGKGMEPQMIIPPNMQECGFTVVKGTPEDRPDSITDWTDREQIGKHYVPIVRKMLTKTYGPDAVEQIVFWNPTLRNTTSLFVAPAHIDTDINAYPSCQALMDLIYDRHIPEAGSTYTKEQWVKALQNGQRFSYVNIWRNLDATPIQQAPLGLFVPRYTEPTGLPNARPVDAYSRWYCYPKLTQDEYLLFCQYDRDARQASDLWHGALTQLLDDKEEHNNDNIPRRSFDLRCFILFKDQKVPKEFDRFHQDNKVENKMKDTEV